MLTRRLKCFFLCQLILFCKIGFSYTVGSLGLFAQKYGQKITNISWENFLFCFSGLVMAMPMYSDNCFPKVIFLSKMNDKFEICK